MWGMQRDTRRERSTNVFFTAFSNFLRIQLNASLDTMQKMLITII